jgi:hypothetical protein
MTRMIWRQYSHKQTTGMCVSNDALLLVRGAGVSDRSSVSEVRPASDHGDWSLPPDASDPFALSQVAGLDWTTRAVSVKVYHIASLDKSSGEC